MIRSPSLALALLATASSAARAAPAFDLRDGDVVVFLGGADMVSLQRAGHLDCITTEIDAETATAGVQRVDDLAARGVGAAAIGEDPGAVVRQVLDDGRGGEHHPVHDSSSSREITFEHDAHVTCLSAVHISRSAPQCGHSYSSGTLAFFRSGPGHSCNPIFYLRLSYVAPCIQSVTFL